MSNWFSVVKKEKFDLIVSNLLYIEYDDDYLSCGDVCFEFLFVLVVDDDGMVDIK